MSLANELPETAFTTKVDAFAQLGSRVVAMVYAVRSCLLRD